MIHFMNVVEFWVREMTRGWDLSLVTHLPIWTWS
jgi:hypothetical protein